MDEKTAAIASAVIAAIAAIITIVIERRSHRRELEKTAVDINTLLLEYYRDLRAWADEVIEVMSEAGYLCDLDPQRSTSIDFFARRHYCRHRLSSLLDRGRLFLPNVQPDQVGTHKPGAYRGLRQTALDLIHVAIGLAGRMNYTEQQPNRELRPQIMDTKKSFTTEIQGLLDPRQQVEQMDRIRCIVQKGTPNPALHGTAGHDWFHRVRRLFRPRRG